MDLPYEPAAFTQNKKLLYVVTIDSYPAFYLCIDHNMPVFCLFWYRWITEDRISKCLEDCQWRDVNLSKKRLYFEYADPVSIEVYSPQKYVQKEEVKECKERAEVIVNESKYEPDDAIVRPLFHQVMKDSVNKWEKCKVGDKLGPSWASHWFKLQLNPKKEWFEKKDNGNSNGGNGSEPEIHLCFNCSSEATLYDENGACLSGFAGGTDQLRCEYVLEYPSKNLKQKWPITVYVEMSCNQFRLNV